MRRAIGLIALLLLTCAFLNGGEVLRSGDLMAGIISNPGGGGSAPPPPVAPAFDPVFNPDGLSNSNKTVTSSGPGAPEGWRSVTTHSSGKIVFRLTWATIGCCGSVGFVPTTFAAANDQAINYIGFDSAGSIWLNAFNGCTGAAGPVPIAGDPVDMAIDFTANLLWVRVNNGNWNSNASANPSTGVGGFDLTCQNQTTPPPSPYFVGVSDGFTPDIWTSALVPDVGTGKLTNFTQF